MPGILPQIRHIVAVMLENRSFDNMCGWLYRDESPAQYLPSTTSAQPFNGLRAGLFNPAYASYFTTGTGETYPIFDKANATNMPNPDPEEGFDDVNYQLFGPEGPTSTPKWPNLGFAINYAKVTDKNIPVQIMQPFSPEQVPVISALAKNFAICDAWFSSVPSDTWPNRSFFHSGTSNGHVVNGNHPNPLAWDVPTIFNVLEDMGISWRVYSDAKLVPALTWIMSPKLWQFSLDRFGHFDQFQKDCATGSLPQYSFLEPSFIEEPNDQHPPHDIVAGEQFLWRIWQAISQSPAWPETLLLITYDEHGGTYDHVMPPWGAACPDEKSNPGEENFTFNRFGIRVPMIAVSPWIQAGTVFRSDAPSGTPYDHTSILATLRDWLQIPPEKMLKSKRVSAAPTLAQILNAEKIRAQLPTIPIPSPEIKQTSMVLPPNGLQRSLVTAQAVKRNDDPVAILASIRTRDQVKQYLQSDSSGQTTR
jgi:phospholipase C